MFFRYEKYRIFLLIHELSLLNIIVITTLDIVRQNGI
jgi:hypothetical protein